ncbi:M56 family metallopeptidase [Brevibacillus massiliensis]|uniref:M56 family metallopeptidase n=1 Tax=Brevibacillus massiliensis TaxID=1118054 RepID=UPI001FE1E096|nr:M56 family metallopeptidase [Brevibacillus massiliensis]
MEKSIEAVIFISGVLIAGTILLQMGMYVLHVLLGREIAFNLIQVCQNGMHLLGLSSLGYVLDAFVFYTLLSTVWKTAEQMLASKKMYNRLRARRHPALTDEINQKYGGKNRDFLVISHPAPLAFTMGFHPRIILSTGLFHALEQAELEAVIYHELYHQKHGDPFKTFLLSLFASVLCYIPILKWLQQKYKIIREVLADNDAINRMGTSVYLGSALVKLLKRGNQVQQPFAHVSFTEVSINYRIKRILDPEAEFPLQLPPAPTMVSIYVLLLLWTVFFVVLSQPA